MAVHGGGYLPGYSGRIDHAWGARKDSHGELPLPPTTYLRQVYLDTVVFTYHQLAYMIDVFGRPHRDGHRLSIRHGRIQSDRTYRGRARHRRSHAVANRRRQRGKVAGDG